jgi:hypothetical protein
MSDLFEKPFADDASSSSSYRAAGKTTAAPPRADQSPVARPPSNVFGACTLDSSGCEFQPAAIDDSSWSGVIPGRRLW